MGPQNDDSDLPYVITDDSPTHSAQTDNTPLPDVIRLTQHPPEIETELEPAQQGETHCSIAAQVVIPFFIAGMGMVTAGIFLDHVQNWKVFVEVSEIIILVPALLGLKGNLEMTLAARLSTQANLGNMDDSKEQWSMILGNLTLVQCQAIVVGLLSAVMAVVMVGVMRQEFDLKHALLLCSCSIITSSIASLVLGLITAAVIVMSHWCHINPDNVATPIAASLGDITSLALLSWVATLLYEVNDSSDWISPVIVVCYILVIPFWVWIVKKNKYTSTVLYTGWVPVVVAMLISTFSGFILDLFLEIYPKLAAFQPVINGVGGNLVSVQASRLSTALHQASEIGTLPHNARICISPQNAFLSKETYAVTARVLMLLVLPGHVTFAYAISYIQSGDASLTPSFLLFYLIAALIQVALLLYVAYIMTYFFWTQKIDPDNSSIPYLTALGDLLGIILLGIAFQILHFLGDKSTIK